MTYKNKSMIFAVLLIGLLLTGCIPGDGFYDLSAFRVTATVTASQTAMVTPTMTAIPPKTCKVTTGMDGGAVNVRAGGGMSFSIIGVVYEGDVLVILEDLSTGWAKVQSPVGEGYFYILKWCTEK